MGFRANTFAKVWKIQPLSDGLTKLQISISRKDKETEQYVKEFSDFVICVGSACAAKAAKLTEGETIKIGDVDVTTKWNDEKKRNYVDFKIFNFQTRDEVDSGTPAFKPAKKAVEVDAPDCDDGDLPF